MKIHKIARRTDKKDEFQYNDEIRNMWRELLIKEKDRVNVGFDLENDDGYETRTKDLDFKNKNGDQFRVKARICWAGGDWESPICYFKCQFQNRSYFDRDNSWGQWGDCVKAIIIPTKSNQNLIRSSKDKTRLVAKGGEDGVGSKDLNEKALWDEMHKLAEKRIKMYWDKYADYVGDMSYDSVAAVRSLLEAYREK